MLKKMMLLTALTTLLAAPAALAGHRDAPYLPAHRLEILADDLTDASRDMRAEAAHRLRGPRRGNRAVLVALDDLAFNAARFEKTVRRGTSPARLNYSFDVLLASFERVDRKMRFVHNGRLQREFRSVERAMFRLTRQIDVASAPRHRRPRDRDRLHGSITFGDRIGKADVRVRIGF